MVFLPADGTPSGREERVLAREGWDHRRGPGSPGSSSPRAPLHHRPPRWAAVAVRPPASSRSWRGASRRDQASWPHAAQVLARSVQIERGGVDVLTDGPVVALGDVAAVAVRRTVRVRTPVVIWPRSPAPRSTSAPPTPGERTTRRLRFAHCRRSSGTARWESVARALPPIGPCRSSSVGNSARGR